MTVSRTAARLLLAALLTTPGAARAQGTPPPDSLSAALEGVVSGRYRGASRALPYAVVEVLAPGLRRAAVADSAGRYRIGRLRPGPARVRVTHPGHDPLTVEVLLPREGSVSLDLELEAHPVELEPLDVTGVAGVPDPSERSPRPGTLPEVEVSVLDLGPGVGQPGLIDALGRLPGNDPADPSDVLFMRGSTTDLKLVLLDGAPVYTPFHVAGLLRSFEPGLLGSATLHVGGAPARYDGGLTHILDLRTRRPSRDALRASGSVDLLSGAVGVEGPLGPSAGVLASARTLHGLGDAPLGGETPYGYSDVVLGLEVEPRAGHTLSATGFWNEESVRLDFPLAPDDAWWSNQAGSLRYRAAVGETLLETVVAAGGYEASLPLRPTPDPEEPLSDPLLASAATERVRLGAEAARPWDDGTVRVGLSYERLDASYSARVLGEGGTTARADATATTLGAYVDATHALADGVSLRAGLRGDLFNGGADGRLAPRAALLWEVAPEALLTVAVGRYHQATRTEEPEVERALTEVVDDAIPGAELLPVASADHVVLSLEQRLRERAHLALEGFWKRYDGLLADPGETVRSSGVDLRIQSGSDRGTAWLGYGLSWFWSTHDLSGLSTDFQGRHLLSAGLSGRVVGAVGAEARVAYGAGLPYTAVPFGRASSDPLSAPTDPVVGDAEALRARPTVLDQEFLRLDLEVHALLERAWAGRDWEIRPYVRVLNALDRRDALFYAFQPWRDDSLRPLAERPLIPVLGVAFRF